MLNLVRRPLLGVGLLALAAMGCGADRPAPAGKGIPAGDLPEESEVGDMKIWSADFNPGQAIPRRFTCDGDNRSPSLSWSGIAPEAKSLALVCDDPDASAGTWVHWIVVNLPPGSGGLPAGGPLPRGAEEVANDFGRKAYGGPCPPSGVHRYFFRLYALDTEKLSGLTRENFSAALMEHALGTAEYMGTYRRQR